MWSTARLRRHLWNRAASPAPARARLTLQPLDDRSVPAATPWGGTAVPFPHGPNPLAIQAENYDVGGPGVAYSDTTAGNSGGAYRTGESVDVAAGGSGHVVGWTAPGEWLGYTVNVEHEHRYDFTARVSSGAVAAGATAGWFHLEFGPVGQVGGAGVLKTELFVVKGTGGWNTFADISLKGIKLPAGPQWMRLVQDTGGYNVDAITVQSTPHTHHEDMYNDVTDVVSDGSTHTAVNSGNWNVGSTWSTGTVPGANAKVRVPSGFAVTYNVASNPARLNWVRVEGTLSFATAQDTHMLVDSLVVMDGGTLNVGTSSAGVAAANRALVQFRSDTSLNLALDKAAMGKGLLSEGNVNVYGANKADWLTTAGAAAGATSITLDAAPAGWRVGDKLVVTGTSYNENGSDADNTRFRDEELTITGISGNTVTFTNRNTGGNSLRFAHTVPAGYGFKVYVGNLTRNVVFETENWQGGTVPDARKGHTLYTADSAVSLNNAGFYGLGRTNKSIDVTDPNKTGDGGATYANPRGRYPVHFHHVNNLNLTATAGRVDGCVVDTSTGWGFTLHSSKADFNSNVSYNVLGAHFMTEEGVELGSFTNNLAVKATGSDGRGNLGNGRTVEPNAPAGAARNHDFGFMGNGFWLQGGGLFRTDNNVAASTHGPAFEVYGDGDDVNNFRNKVNPNNIADAALRADLVAAYGADTIYAWQVPWTSFKDNVAFNTYAGLQYSWQLREPLTPRSSARNVLDGFQVWGNYGSVQQPGGSVRSGSAINIVYAGRLSVKNAVLVGTSTGVADPTATLQRVRVGVDVNYNIRSLILENSTVVGFDQGVAIPFGGKENQSSAEMFRLNKIVGGSFNNRANLVPGERLGLVGSPDVNSPFPTPTFSYVELLNSPSFTVNGPNSLPTAAFTAAAADGLAVRFDGAGSSDPDAAVGIGGNRIAAYGWDFDNNGTIDGWGVAPVFTFASAGTKTVRLTVWDYQGATASTSQTVNVANSSVNAVGDPGVDADPVSSAYSGSSHTGLVSGSRWIAGPATSEMSWAREGGALRLLTDGSNVQATQIIDDRAAHRGQQQLRFDFRNTEGDGTANYLHFRVWGVNAPEVYFANWPYQVSSALTSGAPAAFGSFPFSSTLLYNSGDVTNGTVGWTTHTGTADFGAGYQYIVIAFGPGDVSAADYLAIDNVSIRSAGGVSPPPVTTPAAPSGLTATAASATQVNLTWADNSNNETGFTVEWATNGSFTGASSLTTGANVSGANIAGLLASTTYYFRVRATNSAGASANSATATATMPAAPPTGGGAFTDGEFGTVTQATFTAGTSALNTWHSQTSGNHSSRSASGGNPGAYLGFGQYGSQVVVGRAAPSSAETWTVSFDLIAPQAWGAPVLKVYGLTNGQSVGYAYGGGAGGTLIASHTLGTAASWTGKSFAVNVPAGYSVIAFEWWSDVGQAAGIDNVSIAPPVSNTLLSDGEFAAVTQGNFTAGTTPLGQWTSQANSNHASRAATGGSPGAYLQFGLYGNQVAVGLAAPSSAETWTVSFDYLAPTVWGANFRVRGLTAGQTVGYAYGGSTTGADLLAASPGAQAAWGARSYTFAVSAGYSAIVLEWFGDYGAASGLDDVLVTRG